jgi:release factor glutamine methyltransferase
MNISSILKKYNKIEIELLLAHVLKKPKEFLYMESASQISASQLIRLQTLIKRRLNGEPIAYILGYKDFYGLRFKVNKNVLIPRSETEWIVENVVQAIGLQKRQADGVHYKATSPINILDVGTGSGAIAISLAKEFKIKNLEFRITASDISSASLKVAKQNAKANKVKIKFIKSDLFKNISGKFDIIIANLPYVPKKVYKQKLNNLKWEPKTALIDPVKDFNIYTKFFEQVASQLNPSASIYLEIDPLQKKLLPKIIKKYLPKADIKFHKDLNNLWRFVKIT